MALIIFNVGSSGYASAYVFDDAQQPYYKLVATPIDYDCSARAAGCIRQAVRLSRLKSAWASQSFCRVLSLRLFSVHQQLSV